MVLEIGRLHVVIVPDLNVNIICYVYAENIKELLELEMKVLVFVEEGKPENWRTEDYSLTLRSLAVHHVHPFEGKCCYGNGLFFAETNTE